MAGSRTHPVTEAAAGIRHLAVRIRHPAARIRHPAMRIRHPAILAPAAVDIHPAAAEEVDSCQAEAAVAVGWSWMPSSFISWEQACLMYLRISSQQRLRQ